MTALIDIALITRDSAMQMRTGGLDAGVVVDYAEAFEADAVFPAVTVFSDGDSFWLADGFHRIAGAEKAGRTQILADVRQGNRRDAILHAAGANAFHGMRRTGDDKRRAVLAMLQDPEWSNWSDREIGKRCAVDHKTVAKVRRDLVGNVPTERTYTTKHGTVSTMRVAAAEAPAPAGGSMVERLLAKATDDALRAECQRRGWEVAHAH
jgi:hypothetical protein